MIQLSYTIDTDKGTLTLVADADARREIAELIDYKGATDMTEIEALEYLLSNTELQYVHAVDTGDLTDAPMLGILGDEQREASGPYGYVKTGHDEQGLIYQPILDRWAYMDYAVRSFLTDLSTTGKAIFTNH